MNAELIKALRETDFGYVCEHCEHEDMCRNNDCVIIQAADALEAADKRIVNLLTALYLANEKLAYVDCQPYTEIDGEEMIDDWVKTLVYEELKAQLPKEAHWVAVENGHGVCSNCNRQDSIDNMATHCRYCGAKMRGEHE